MATFPCPNPTCTQTFSPQAVQGVNQLVCPRCGMTFQFRHAGGAPAAKPAAPAGQQPRATPPPARAGVKPPVTAPRPQGRPTPPPPPQPTRPVSRQAAPRPGPAAPPRVARAAPAVADPPPPQGLNFDSTPDVLVSSPLRSRRRRQSVWSRLLVLFVALLILGGAGAIGYHFLPALTRLPGEGEQPAEARKKREEEQRLEESRKKTETQQAFYFQAVPEGFADDPLLREPFTFRDAERKNEPTPPVLSLASRNPEAWLVATARDYRTRLPSEGEMVESALQKLKKFLEDGSLQWERLPEGRLAGRPAIVLAFVGENTNHIRVEGEVAITAAQGYAFLVYTWAPEVNGTEARKTWTAQRDAFRIGEQRASWKEVPVRKERFPVPGTDLEVPLAERVWRRQDLPEDPTEPKLLLQFLGGDPSEEQKGQPRPTAGKNATLYVYALPKADSDEAAYQMMEDALRKQHEGTNDAKVKVDFKLSTDRAGTQRKGPATLGPGAFPAYVARMDVLHDEQVQSYAVVAVVRVAEGQHLALVFDALLLKKDTENNRREFWDTEFTAVLESLTRKKK